MKEAGTKYLPTAPPKFHEVASSLSARREASEKDCYALDSMLIVSGCTLVAEQLWVALDCNVVGRRGSSEGRLLGFFASLPGGPLKRNNR